MILASETYEHAEKKRCADSETVTVYLASCDDAYYVISEIGIARIVVLCQTPDFQYAAYRYRMECDTRANYSKIWKLIFE